MPATDEKAQSAPKALKVYADRLVLTVPDLLKPITRKAEFIDAAIVPRLEELVAEGRAGIVSIQAHKGTELVASRNLPIVAALAQIRNWQDRHANDCPCRRCSGQRGAYERTRLARRGW